MRFSLPKFTASVFGMCLLASTVAVPSMAKQPSKLQSVNPLLLTQSSMPETDSATDTPPATALPSDASPEDIDSRAAAQDAPGAGNREKFRNFLDTNPSTSNSPSTLRVRVTPSLQLDLSLDVGDFIYTNGGIGQPNGLTNSQIFNSFFTTQFGVLSGSNRQILSGPLTATATSAFSPFLSQTDLDKLKSVTVKFDFAFVPNSGDKLNLQIRNTTTGQTTFNTAIVFIRGTGLTADITNAFTQPGQYSVRYRLVKPGSTNNDAAGFNNVTVTIVRK